MAPKKPTAAFEVRFEGGGVYPERIPLPLLSEALSAIQRLAAGEEGFTDDKEKQDHSIRLLDVIRGSAVYRCLAPSPQVAVSRLRTFGGFLDKPAEADNLAYAFSAIDKLSSIAAKLGCRITLRNPNKRDDVLATIRPETFDTLAQEVLIVGHTTITGIVERVGNATGIRCALRLPTQARQLICRVRNQQLARQLGDHLYEPVTVSGRARWLRTNWNLMTFTVEEFHEHKDASIAEMVRDLRKAGGRAWDQIEDPEEFLRQVTGEK